MAAADRFWVNITGRGGHAAMPHLSIDPVVAASQVCTSRLASQSWLHSPLPVCTSGMQSVKDLSWARPFSPLGQTLEMTTM